MHHYTYVNLNDLCTGILLRATPAQKKHRKYIKHIYSTLYLLQLSNVNTRVSVSGKIVSTILLFVSRIQCIVTSLQLLYILQYHVGTRRSVKLCDPMYYYKTGDRIERIKKHRCVGFFRLPTVHRRRALVENSPRKIENSNLFSKRFV